MQRQVPVPPSEPDKVKEGAGQRKLPPLPAKFETLNKLDEALENEQKNKKPRNVIVCMACINEGLGHQAARDHYLHGTPFPLGRMDMVEEDEECIGTCPEIIIRACSDERPVLSPEERIAYYGSSGNAHYGNSYVIPEGFTADTEGL